MNYITIDIGGTAIKYGVINDELTFLEKDLVATKTAEGGSVIIDQCCQIISNMLEKYDIAGVGISTAGMVDVKRGEIYYSSPLIPDYTGTNFKTIVKKRFDLPCAVENDVNCAGLAESVLGSGKDDEIVFTTTIGTGIGGCLTINGKVFHGASYAAGEVGYMKVMAEEFQMLGSSKTLVERVAILKNEPVSAWDGKKVFEGTKAGDKHCKLAIDEMCEALGYGFANICYMYNPNSIVIGGGITAQGDYLLHLIDNYLQKYLIPQLYNVTSLKIAQFHNDAGMIGAYLNFKQQYKD